LYDDTIMTDGEDLQFSIMKNGDKAWYSSHSKHFSCHMEGKGKAYIHTGCDQF